MTLAAMDVHAFVPAAHTESKCSKCGQARDASVHGNHSPLEKSQPIRGIYGAEYEQRPEAEEKARQHRNKIREENKAMNEAIKEKHAKLDPVKMASLLGTLLLEEKPDPEAKANAELQDTAGDKHDQAISTFSQHEPNPQGKQKANPMSPIEGDEIFFTYMIPGAIFQANDGSLWNILDYEWDGRVEIENVWYPREHAQVSLDDIRRSIHAWVVPVQQTVPPAPEGVSYGAQSVKIVK